MLNLYKCRVINPSISFAFLDKKASRHNVEIVVVPTRDKDKSEEY
jgi:hypothetical protein